MEELTENAEEDEESKHSEQKLGKLQYKVNSMCSVFVFYVCVCYNYNTFIFINEKYYNNSNNTALVSKVSTSSFFLFFSFYSFLVVVNLLLRLGVVRWGRTC